MRSWYRSQRAARLAARSRSLTVPAGEVTLTGRVLPIGGVKEKTLAARRSGVKTLVFPAGNKRDYDELSGAPAKGPASEGTGNDQPNRTANEKMLLAPRTSSW